MKYTLWFYSLLPLSLNAQATTTDYVSVSGNPTGIAFDKNGTLFIGTESDYAIKKFPLNGTLSTLKSDIGGQPRQISIDDKGNIWIAHQSFGGIKKMNPSDAKSVSYTNSYPHGVFQDPTSKSMFFSDLSSGKIFKMKPEDTGFSEFVISPAITRPTSIIFDNNSNMYIATTSSNEVLQVSPDGNSKVIIDNIRNPSYLALDSNQNIYVSNDYNGQIYNYNLSNTNKKASLFVSDLHYSNGLAVYNNDLYCAIVSRNKIVKIPLNTLSLDESKEIEHKISIHPNPANNFIKVDNLENIESLSLFSIEGLLVTSNKNNNLLDISNASSGVYTLKIDTKKYSFSRKIIKK